MLGVTVSERRFAMISEWMENGNINEFIRKGKYVNRTKLVCHLLVATPMEAYRPVVQLVDAANGLAYMHSLRMVHGDLKGVCLSRLKHLHACCLSPKANILINNGGQACLADFGLSTITGVATHAAAGASWTSLISIDSLMSFTAGGTYRWMSPELLDPGRFGIPHSEGSRPTRQSDCYAFGMVIYEVCVCVNKLIVVNSKPVIL